MNMEDEFLQLKIDPETKRRLTVIAHEQDRSMSAAVRWLINREFDTTRPIPDPTIEQDIARRLANIGRL
jgi:antitoxin component of RelBE/YafQ-DinJ toxin-antitoxin module